MDVIFAGGSGRSGTTVIAKLLRRHPEVRASNPLEIRCLTDSGGLLDLCLGPTRDGAWQIRLAHSLPGVSQRIFVYRLRRRWWSRINRLGRSSGLHRGLTAEQRESLLDRLSIQLRKDAVHAGRDFVLDLARCQGCDQERYWVDTSPPNIANADRISQMFPQARFIHMVRDGRETIASVLAEPWGPSTVDEAVHWWTTRMRKAHLATSRIDSSRLLTMSLESLVVNDRNGEYRRLLSFLSLDDSAGMVKYFNARMPSERVNPGRWTERVANPDALESSYAKAAEQLEREGVPVYQHPGS